MSVSGEDIPSLGNVTVVTGRRKKEVIRHSRWYIETVPFTTIHIDARKLTSHRRMYTVGSRPKESVDGRNFKCRDEAQTLEQLLIQHIALTWLLLGMVVYQYTERSTDRDTTYQSIYYWEKRLNAAQRRFLRASETLARIRKMNLPTVQVNIGKQQINQVNT